MSLATREIRPLGQNAARALTDRIKREVNGLWSLLLDAYEGKAWAALGYLSWTEYVQTEFDYSRTHSYALLDQARVNKALAEASGVSYMSDVREARDLKPVLNEVTQAVRDRLRSGDKERAAEIVREEVDKARSRSASARGAKELMDELNPPDFDPAADRARTLRVGAFHSVLEELLTFAAPAELIPDFRPFQFEYAEMVPKAIAWLTEFEQEWRNVHG